MFHYNPGYYEIVKIRDPKLAPLLFLYDIIVHYLPLVVVYKVYNTTAINYPLCIAILLTYLLIFHSQLYNIYSIMRDLSRNIIHQISRTYRFNPSTPRDFNRKTQTGHPQHKTCSPYFSHILPKVEKFTAILREIRCLTNNNLEPSLIIKSIRPSYQWFIRINLSQEFTRHKK